MDIDTGRWRGEVKEMDIDTGRWGGRGDGYRHREMGYRHREVDFDKEANLRAPSSGTQSF
jgi:hypothetical protein